MAGNREEIYGDLVPITIDEIFNDYVGRRAGLIKALTIDFVSFASFAEECQEGATDGHRNQCLYGMATGKWEINNNDEPELYLPEPPKCLANIVPKGINKRECASRVANHSDAWLLTVVNDFSNRIHLFQAERLRLHDMIAELTTVFQVVSAYEFPVDDDN
ncbi:Phd finger protein alfin-like 7 [Heracleum sosnowskyi]|uniref:PHD finger protein ALFIN-LIKE n=1 Tax=Heracleum sosnowskyi TaxID=360622 RepID=A0AAD8I272_9APIA|nr:Phd finger protein alfin-like 7 [Heracleum sosnowskyi]